MDRATVTLDITMRHFAGGFRLWPGVYEPNAAERDPPLLVVPFVRTTTGLRFEKGPIGSNASAESPHEKA